MDEAPLEVPIDDADLVRTIAMVIANRIDIRPRKRSIDLSRPLAQAVLEQLRLSRYRIVRLPPAEGHRSPPG